MRKAQTSPTPFLQRRSRGLRGVRLSPLHLNEQISAGMARGVSLVPCVDGSELARTFFTHAGWSVQPCVRPLSAVHMTAGHNALRGSGPGQNRAFKDAVALVGCPDRRIDRLCITCCSPSQPSHHAGSRRDLATALARPDNCIARPWPSWPRPFERACWQARWPRPWSAVGPAAL